MSDSCFSIEQIDKVKKKAKGLLQFTQATAIKLPVMRRMQMTEDMPIIGTEIKTTFLDINKQMPRSPNFSNIQNKHVSKEDFQAMTILPGHMHNIANRMGCSSMIERSLRETSNQYATYLDGKSLMNSDKKSFRKDSSASPPPNRYPKKKKKMTFEE